MSCKLRSLTARDRSRHLKKASLFWRPPKRPVTERPTRHWDNPRADLTGHILGAHSSYRCGLCPQKDGRLKKWMKSWKAVSMECHLRLDLIATSIVWLLPVRYCGRGAALFHLQLRPHQENHASLVPVAGPPCLHHLHPLVQSTKSMKPKLQDRCPLKQIRLYNKLP